MNARDRWGNTPLCDCVREGHARLAKLLLEHGGKLHYEPSRAASELCEHAGAGRLETLTLLLDCGVPASAADYDARTACHIAASEGHRHVVEELLRRGEAREIVELKDRWGGRPVDDAQRHGHAEVVKLLEKAGGGAVKKAI